MLGLFPPSARASVNGNPAVANLPQIPGYEIERQLGRGGMATVYLAKQVSLDRPVAIKLMAPEAGRDESMAQRFESEARVIAKLEHGSIVGIHEVGRAADGRLFYVMPFLPNGDLAHRDLAQDELGIVQVLRALLEALGYAHARGVVHRDVKPENVLFDAQDRPRLADFGIALSPRPGNPRITSDGLTLGSSGYMSPEQARGERVDGRADLYSVGVLAYELLSGDMPYRASDPLALAIMHAQDPVPRLPPSRRHWQGLIDRAMAKRPEQRFRNAAAMLRALDHVERELTRRARGSLRAWLAVPPLRSSPVLQLGLGLTLSLGLALGVLALVRPGNDPDTNAPSPQAQIERLLGEAASQLNAGALVMPAGANAAESYLAVLALRPDHLEAGQGLVVVFDSLGEQFERAYRTGDAETARTRFEQARLLAERVEGTPAAEGMVRVRARAQALLDAQVAAAHARQDRAAAQAHLDLLTTLGLDATAAGALMRQLQAWPEAGARLRDQGGPVLRFVVDASESAQRRRQPFALMERPVSVGDYRRFMQDTRREASRCRARLSPLRLIDQRDWATPGFTQTDTDPVACVSQADAVAYAQWLARRTGQRYRLASAAELARAGQGARAGVAFSAAAQRFEWTSDCATPGRDGGCREQLALDPGTDFRRQPPAERTTDGTRGYDDIGFRLLRELSLETLPPRAE